MIHFQNKIRSHLIATVTMAPLTLNLRREQGRKSMFKHGGDNIVEKYTFRLRDELRGAKRPVFLGGFGGMSPEKKILNGAIWCVLVYIWIGFDFKKF